MEIRRLLQVVVASCAGSFLGFSLFVAVGLLPWCGADDTDCRCDTPGVACCNGDVNGDHAIDIADALYLLQYLFGGGPEPSAFDCASGELICRLPESGQRVCYDWMHQPVDCDDCAECVGQNGYYRAGLPFEDRFTDNGNGTVTDNHAGLMWQQVVTEETRTWWDALDYCENLELAGYTDWRLSNNMEALTLGNLSFGNGVDTPAMDPVFQVPLGYFWTSTTLRFAPNRAICVENIGPISSARVKTDLLYVIAVRTFQPGE